MAISFMGREEKLCRRDIYGGERRVTRDSAKFSRRFLRFARVERENVRSEI